jgi:hypothetical protein
MYLAGARGAARVLADFCVANPPRYQHIAQRTVPGFTPSAESAALARRAFGAELSSLRDLAARKLVPDPGAVWRQLARRPEMLGLAV